VITMRLLSAQPNRGPSHVTCWTSKACIGHAAWHALWHDTWAHWVAGILVLFAVVALIGRRLDRSDATTVYVTRGGTLGSLACAAAAVVIAVLYFRHDHPATGHAAPRPAPRPTITHVTVVHQAASAGPSWPIVALMGIACLTALIVVLNIRRGDS